MTFALLCVAMFLGGWATGRWDILGEHAGRFGDVLRGPRLLAVCVCLVFAGALYLVHTPASSRLLVPTLEQR